MDEIFPLRQDTNTHHLMMTNPSYSTDNSALSHWENLFAKDDAENITKESENFLLTLWKNRIFFNN